MYPAAIRIALLYALAVGCPLSAGDPRDVLPEQLAPPQELPSPMIVLDESCCFHTPTRINRYAIWELYAVDRSGQFRPRVIYSPYGSFYLYNGQPYPWVSTHQLDFALQIISPW